MEHDLLLTIIANTISATDISKILYKHSDSDILTGDHIICGLIYRLMNPMTDEEIDKSLNDSNDLLNEEYNSSDEEEIETEIIDDTNSSKIQQKIKSNNCNCDICIQTRVCLLNFNDYIPNDTLGDKFKNSIIETCQKYNRYI